MYLVESSNPTKPTRRGRTIASFQRYKLNYFTRVPAITSPPSHTVSLFKQTIVSLNIVIRTHVKLVNPGKHSRIIIMQMILFSNVNRRSVVAVCGMAHVSSNKLSLHGHTVEWLLKMVYDQFLWLFIFIQFHFILSPSIDAIFLWFRFAVTVICRIAGPIRWSSIINFSFQLPINLLGKWWINSTISSFFLLPIQLTNEEASREGEVSGWIFTTMCQWIIIWWRMNGFFNLIIEVINASCSPLWLVVLISNSQSPDKSLCCRALLW